MRLSRSAHSRRNPKKHLLILTLKHSSVTTFEEHIDHAAHTVTYLADPKAAEYVSRYRGEVAELVQVADPTDVEGQIFPAAAAIFGRHGPADAVFTSSEYDLLTAARIRERFGIPGMTEARTLAFRDKVVMKEQLSGTGVAVPRFTAPATLDAIAALTAGTGYPVVLKPRQGMGSRGIHVLTDSSQLPSAVREIDPNAYECEEFVHGPIYHVDGLMGASGLRFLTLSRYVNSCLDATRGLPLGSVMVDDPELRRMAAELTETALTALELRDNAFHLEFILRDGRTPVFLEVGARAGGGQIQPVTEELYGVDLLRTWVALQLGEDVELPSALHPVGGWLVIPEPCEPPYRVVDIEPLAGRVPHLYHEQVPHPGEVFDAARLRRDRWPGGRFRYAGPSTRAVERAVRDTIRHYRLEAVGLGGGPARGELTSRSLLR
ncbi:ATP-grasp domain-containing protein [Streptomyces sp. BR1]|uniref:ATP-grasp domain-containing protein n=1 Tax=Streptomyces sp. BR1 TaxID=1592323 RepID=UPI00402B7CE7